MSRMNFGDKMPKTYFEAYKPVEGQMGRIAILSVEAMVGVQYHWVDNTKLGIPNGTRGMFTCTQGACCACGLWNPIQSYAFPIWVFVNPPDARNGNPGSADGILQMLKLPSRTYEALVALYNQGVDLEAIDLFAQSVKQGSGTTLQLNIAPGASLLSKDYRQQIVAGVPDLAGQIERSLAKPCTEEDWNRIIAEATGGPQAQMQQSAVQPRPVVRQANPAQLFGGAALPQGQQAALPAGQQFVPNGAPTAPQAAHPQFAPQAAVPQASRPQFAPQAAASQAARPQAAPAGFPPVRQPAVTQPPVKIGAAPAGFPPFNGQATRVAPVSTVEAQPVSDQAPADAPVEEYISSEEAASLLNQ